MMFWITSNCCDIYASKMVRYNHVRIKFVVLIKLNMINIVMKLKREKYFCNDRSIKCTVVSYFSRDIKRYDRHKIWGTGTMRTFPVQNTGHAICWWPLHTDWPQAAWGHFIPSAHYFNPWRWCIVLYLHLKATCQHMEVWTGWLQFYSYIWIKYWDRSCLYLNQDLTCIFTRVNRQ